MTTPQFDLAILVPDKNTESAIRGILSRPDSLGLRPVRFNLFVHPERDPGCCSRSHDYAHALVVFDRVGSGQESLGREDLAQAVTDRLSGAGWDERAGCVVIDPELEVWVWSDSPHVDICLGWEHHEPALRAWLKERGLWPERPVKPPEPKRATEEALRQVRRPRSSAISGQLAASVSLQRCTDPSFVKLRQLLEAWFGQAAPV